MLKQGYYVNSLSQFFHGKKIISLVIAAMIILLIWLGHHFLTRKVGRYLYLHGEGVCEVSTGTIHYVLNGISYLVPVSSNGIYQLPLSIRHVTLQLSLKKAKNHSQIYHPECNMIKLADDFKTFITFTQPNPTTATCKCIISAVDKTQD